MILDVTEKEETSWNPKVRKRKGLFSNIKTNWLKSTNPEEYLGFKEILSYSFTGSGVGGVSSLSIYQISAVVLYFMGSTITLTGLVKTPIVSMIMDNSQNSKGKFKPYLLWSSIISMILLVAIPFIPVSWTEIIAFDLLNEPVSVAAIAIFILHFLLSWSFPIMNVSYTGLGQRMTPNTMERAKMFSYQSLIASLWSSVVGILFPLLSILTQGDASTGLESLLSYRVFFPLFGITSILFIFVTYNNVKERIIVEKNYQPKVKFWNGIKSLATNKYFWIITVNAMMIPVRGMDLATWINVYSLKSEVAASITTILFGNALIPGMLLTGYLVKKVGKRNLMLVSGLITTLSYIPMILFPSYPILFLCLIFLQNLSGGFGVCLRIMPADALDWQQLKTGERLEGFWGMFILLLLSIIGLGTGVLVPLVLRASGMTAGADILENEVVRFAVFRNISIISMIASAFATLPFFFWDLSEEKHHNIIKQLESIAKEKNEKRIGNGYE